LAATGALVWILTEGASFAAAATRYRSGGVTRTQLVGHYGQGASSGSPAFVPMGADLMAGVVGLLLVAALVFMVVTFIRRRVVTTA
jgi:uncharacterized membrane protein